MAAIARATHGIAFALLLALAGGAQAAPSPVPAIAHRVGPPSEAEQRADHGRCLRPDAEGGLNVSSNPACLQVVAGAIRQALAVMDAEDAAEAAANAAAEREAARRKRQPRKLAPPPGMRAPQLHAVPLRLP